MQHEYPILEFDPDVEAFIDPRRTIKAIDIPERCVVCFFQEVIADLKRAGRLRRIACQRSEIGEHPVYALELHGQPLAVFHPGVGAPLAAALLEEVIGLGCRTFIACGGAGSLDKRVAFGYPIIPHVAVRDEGTSYHYLPPSREVSASPAGVAALEQVLESHGLDYLVAKTWTTDGFYRETPARIQRRRAEGCVTVEMEAAACFAVAQFRGVTFAHLLYGGDDLSGHTWDSREWTGQLSTREKLFWLTAEACLRL